jgi:hypothetical protein
MERVGLSGAGYKRGATEGLRSGNKSTLYPVSEAIPPLTILAKMKTFPKLELMDCPGAWYGTAPSDVIADDPCGHVVIDPRNCLEAIRWLKRRTMNVTIESTTSDGGLFVRFVCKGKPCSMPVAI